MAAGIIKTREDTISARDAEIAGLESELDKIRAAHAPCDAQIKELKAHLARLDKELAAELEKEEALAKELAEEKRKEAEQEQSLKKTKADLEKDERDLAEDKKVRSIITKGCDHVMTASTGLSALMRALETMEEELAVRGIPGERSVMLLQVSMMMMIVLFIVFFQNQTSNTFGEGKK